jgi:hypothetical protein
MIKYTVETKYYYYLSLVFLLLPFSISSFFGRLLFGCIIEQQHLSVSVQFSLRSVKLLLWPGTGITSILESLLLPCLQVSLRSCDTPSVTNLLSQLVFLFTFNYLFYLNLL